MANIGLLEKFADPNVINTLTSSERILASLMVTLLGMGITFSALVIIWGVIGLMSKIMAPKPKSEPVVVETVSETVAVESTEENDEELIAVITAAVAASLNTSIHNVVVRNIVRSNDNSTAWSRAGMVDRINANL